eukprot:scaffold85041_cov33-Phaeocystis_antarctica.AAC.1
MECLLEPLARGRVGRLHHELAREDVSQLGACPPQPRRMAGWLCGSRAGARAREGPPVGRRRTVAIATAGHLLLAVVVVAARQQVACDRAEALHRGRGGWASTGGREAPKISSGT